MLDEALQAVRDFHREKNIQYHQRLTTPLRATALSSAPMRPIGPAHGLPVTRLQESHVLSRLLLTRFHKTVEDGMPDYRWLRAHLIMEEATETVEAILNDDEEQTLDGLCDLVYVACGAADTFDLPLSAAFREVHHSNMTKAASTGEQNPRLKDKGADWEPPQITAILREYRDKQEREVIGQ